MREEPPELAGPTPSRARIVDHYLGGTEHLRVDCEISDEADRVFPAMRQMVWDHRRFTHAVVRHLAGTGIDQFLELGSGLPTGEHVHAVAGPDARVVYVDRDAETVAHGARLVAGEPGVSVVQADLTDVAEVLATPGVRELIDLDRPLAVLAVAVLNTVDDETARATVHGFREAVAPGSALAVSHPTGHGRPDLVAFCELPHTGWTYAPVLRDPDDMAPWLAGLDLVGPGWACVRHWAPEGTAPGADVTGSGIWGVVARVPRTPA